MAVPLKQSWTATASEFVTYNSTKLATGIVLGMCSAYAVSSIMYGTRNHESDEPVLIRGRAFYGCSADILDNMKKYLEQCRAAHGDIFTLKMAYNSYTTFIMDNAMMKKVLANKHASWSAVSITAKKRFGLSEITDHLPQGIDILSHALHDAFSNKAKLTMLTKQAHIASQRALKSVLDSVGNKRSWTECTQTLNEWVRDIVVRLELEIFFGELFANDSELIDLYFAFEKNVPLRLNTEQQTVTPDAMQPLMNRIQYLCEQYEGQKTASPYCIAWASSFCKKHNLSTPLTRNRLIVELLWASLTNSYHSVTWVLCHVLKEKQCELQILKELQAMPFFQLNSFDDENSGVKSLQLRQLYPTLCAVMNEVFRFYGQSNVYRCLQADVFLKDSKDPQKVYKLRRGDWVAGCSSFLHRNDTYFENGQQFKWNRFVDNHETNQRRRTSRFNQKKIQNMFTFGTQCVGRHFAENFIALFAAFVLKNFEIQVITNKADKDVNDFNVPRIGEIAAFSIPGIDCRDDLAFKLRQRI